MNSDLMHAASVRFAKDNTGFAIKRQSFEFGTALFPLGRYATHSNFVANHFDRFAAYNIVTRG